LGLNIIQQKQVKKDIERFGYNTTIGLAQFHEQLLNRVKHSVDIVKRGRPPKVYTGKKGRPSKVKSTKKAQEAAKAKKLGRKPLEQPNDWDSDSETDV